jgi:flagellar motility protein MotE (MotC chaperone)
MKGWIIKGVGTLVAVAAFPFAVFGVLAAQGRLTSPEVETFRHLPIVGDLLPPAEEVPVPEGLTPAGERRPGEGEPTRKWPATARLADPGALVDDLNAQRTLYDRKLQDLEKERLRLERLAEDIADQENVLERVQKDLREERAALDHERRRLAAEGKVITESEAKTFKAMARVFAEMDTEKAAETISDLEPERAAMILRVMDASAQASVLGEVRDPEKRKDLVDRVSRLHKE